MTLAELDAAVAAHLGPDVTYSIGVDSFRHAHRADSRDVAWSIWVSGGEYVKASTPEGALNRLVGEPSTSTLERASAALEVMP